MSSQVRCQEGLLKVIPSTLIKTTGYDTNALFLFVVNEKPLSLSQMEVWCFALHILQICPLLHSLPLVLPCTIKTEFSLKIFSSLICISNSFTLNWFVIFFKKINSPLILYPHSSVPNNISFLLLFNGFFWWLRGFLSVHYLSASANCPNVYSC